VIEGKANASDGGGSGARAYVSPDGSNKD
jgi:hypothetical protein